MPADRRAMAAVMCRHRPRRGPLPPGSPGTTDPPTGDSPEARWGSQGGAAGAERSELDSISARSNPLDPAIEQLPQYRSEAQREQQQQAACGAIVYHAANDAAHNGQRPQSRQCERPGRGADNVPDEVTNCVDGDEEGTSAGCGVGRRVVLIQQAIDHQRHRRYSSNGGARAASCSRASST